MCVCGVFEESTGDNYNKATAKRLTAIQSKQFVRKTTPQQIKPSLYNLNSRS